MSQSYAVIIPTLNRPHYLVDCLAALAKQTVPITECVIVDQSDGPETRELFERTALGTTKKTYVHQKEKSLIRARNRGLDEVSNVDFISFLDDDDAAYPDFYEKLLARFAADTKREYAAGMGTFDHVEKGSDLFLKLFFLPHYGSGRYLPNGLPTFPHWKTEFSEVEFLSGGMSLFRAPLIKEYRYDDRLGGYGYGDDIDITYRLSRKYKLFIEPAAKLKHRDEAPGRDPGTLFRKRQYQNFFYLLQKNVGLNLKSGSAFAWTLFGQMLDDLKNRRASALKGDVLAAVRILLDDLDSVDGYKEFKTSRKSR